MLERGGFVFEAARKIVPKEQRAAVRRRAYDAQDFIRYGVPNLVYYGTPDMFQNACFESNQACNFNQCWYCPNSITPRGDQEMSDGVYKTFVSQLSKIGRHGFRGLFAPVFYNEPLLMGSRLTDMMAYARRSLPLASIQVFTNGTLITPEFYTNLVRAGVDKITITRHPGARRDRIENLLTKLPSEEVKTHIVDRTLDGIKLWERAPIKIPNDKVLHLERCPMASSQLTVDWQGKVIFCCNNFAADHIEGEITKKDLQTIWKDKEFTKQRENARRGIFTLTLCRQCMGLPNKAT